MYLCCNEGLPIWHLAQAEPAYCPAYVWLLTGFPDSAMHWDETHDYDDVKIYFLSNVHEKSISQVHPHLSRGALWHHCLPSSPWFLFSHKLAVAGRCRLAAISSSHSRELLHNNVPPCQHSLTHRYHSDPVPALSLPLRAEYWQSHSEPPCPVCAVYKEQQGGIKPPATGSV